MSSVLTSDSSPPTTNSSYDINEKSSVIITNPPSSSSFSTSTSRSQSSVLNKYKNFVSEDITHPLSTLKQMNQILSNHQSNLNNKYSIEDEIVLREMFIGGHENNIISDSVLLREALDKYLHWRSKRRADPYLRSIGSKNEITSPDSPPPVPPPPPPPPPPHPPSALSNAKISPHRITVDDLHQSPLLQNLTTTTSTNGDYRSSVYSNHSSSLYSNHSSAISKLLSNRRESDVHSINKEQQQQQTAPRIREISSNVGFVSLPDQVHRRAIKKGFEFNLMVVGQSGLGKSTFINTLFQTELYGQDFPSTVHRKKKTISIDSSSIILKEKGVQLRLTIVDTPGFGDSVDNSNCWQPIIDYIDSKYEEYLNAESRVVRKCHIIDNRIHTCLYFITPTGHSLQSLDIEFMKRLHDRVNIIPVIAKADTLTSDELRLFKKSIMQDIINEKIKLYEFPDNQDENKITKTYKDKVPFAVVGSNFVLERGTKRARVRQYAWGTVDVEDEAHSDFIALRSMIIKTNLNDLRDVTHNNHYENYRYKKLSSFNTNESKNGKTFSTPSINKNLLSQIEDERMETEARLDKMSRDMENVYQSKVEEKLQKLEENKQNLSKTQETYQSNIHQEEEKVEQKRQEFERNRRQWEENINKGGLHDQHAPISKSTKKGLF